jgi:hypothetical protein
MFKIEIGDLSFEGDYEDFVILRRHFYRGNCQNTHDQKDHIHKGHHRTLSWRLSDFGNFHTCKGRARYES